MGKSAVAGEGGDGSEFSESLVAEIDEGANEDQESAKA